MKIDVFVDIVITFLIALATSLIVLWSQEGVSSFSDINEVTYAVAFLGAAAAALKGYRSRVMRSPSDAGKLL